ncbi:hypothetical protein MHZ92_10880 [Sporosarcina sp. ACRSL]|uniref:hypothetical protein n=1 Tax=Sporosarcina sp. ACRSL TaxID=2918215 RepID=UPI001EF576FD|nr:hypothetical protein [Sporosarcina sp. ACRSL]MCG7344643.1 hypothetical protein [Sporosarcina sp. ACRSL]
MALVTLLVLFVSGCGSSHQTNSSDLEDYEVEKTIDENVQGDFVFRLVSEKNEYGNGEDVKLFGEITYAGDKDEVTIYHSSSAILFTLVEKTRIYNIEFAVNDIGLSTVLKQGVPYREEYVKTGGYSGDAPSDYVRFIKNFLSNDGFPTGYYVVNGETDFFLEDRERVSIKATIDFKVVD